MNIYKYPSRSEWTEILSRPDTDMSQFYEPVQQTLNLVKEQKDQGLLQLEEKFDGVKLDALLVSQEEIDEGCMSIKSDLKEAINVAKFNIHEFHAAQRPQQVKLETIPGVVCWQKAVPIEKVGLYIPGGTAPLFSSVLMLGIPAKIAGCKEIVLCTPPNTKGKIHPAILYAASLIGITKVFKIGGAQAIAAMAYGTESVPKVSKIFGPGNRYVTAAKQLVSLKDTAIDMPAGPSEVQVLADESANAAFIASDLLSQAEHGPDSQVILVTNHEPLIEEVEKEVEKQLEFLPRREFALGALNNSRIVLLDDIQEMIEMTNQYAPEHLIISMRDDEWMAERIINAGSIFLGNYTPESAGDYASGTNHTLPTHGYATAYSGVNLDSFLKKITYQKISEKGLERLGPHIEKMAEAEELDAHKNAVTIRLNSLKQ